MVWLILVTRVEIRDEAAEVWQSPLLKREQSLKLTSQPLPAHLATTNRGRTAIGVWLQGTVLGFSQLRIASPTIFPHNSGVLRPRGPGYRADANDPREYKTLFTTLQRSHKPEQCKRN